MEYGTEYRIGKERKRKGCRELEGHLARHQIRASASENEGQKAANEKMPAAEIGGKVCLNSLAAQTPPDNVIVLEIAVDSKEVSPYTGRKRVNNAHQYR